MKLRISPGVQSAAVRFTLALFAATMLMSRTFASNSREMNRFYGHWSRMDALALITATVLLAVVAFAGYYLVLRMDKPRAREFYGFLFVGVVGSGIIQVLPVIRHKPRILEVLWLILAAALAWAYLRRQTRVVTAARSLCLTFSLLVPILFWQAVAWPTFHTPARRLNFPKPATAKARPIFLFLFDEFSFMRATRGGRFKPELPNLCGLQSVSLMFENAQSEGYYTAVSVPRLLFEPSSKMVVKDGSIFVEGAPDTRASQESRSLFTIAREHGYNTSVVGIYLPYGTVFGPQLDSSVQRVWAPCADTFASKVALHIVREARFLPDPVSSRLGNAKEEALIQRTFFDLLRNTHADSLAVLRSCPPNTFAYFHSPGTHPPLVVDRNGSFIHGRSSYAPDRYEEQMRYVDKLVGELIGTLKQSGKYDDALIILCSDHSFKTEVDPAVLATPGWMYHVPLVVKWPGQTKERRIDRPFSLAQMSTIVTAALDGRNLDEADAAIDAAPIPARHTETGPVEAAPTGDDSVR
jgi:hypothetical protein